MIITLVRKSLEKNVCTTVTNHSCGGINIDGTRLGTGTGVMTRKEYPNMKGGNYGQDGEDYKDRDNVVLYSVDKGRFPSNVLISHSGAVAIDEQSGVSISTGGRIGNANGVYANQGKGGWKKEFEKGESGYGDTGGASRYFKVVKEDEI